MALAQRPPQRLRGGFAPLGAVHGRGAMHDGRLADTRAQVHTKFMQCLLEQSVRRAKVGDADGWDALCGPPIGNYDESVEDTRGVYV